ncbi:hypothetical protein M3J09_001850 [Ascochyta lentis]
MAYTCMENHPPDLQTPDKTSMVVSNLVGRFCTHQLPLLEVRFQPITLGFKTAPCLLSNNAGRLSACTGHLTFTAPSRSTRRRSCGVTMCTKIRSGPAVRREGVPRGRVSG